ncbi:MAG: signal peptidase I [Clostridia bacterium]
MDQQDQETHTPAIKPLDEVMNQSEQKPKKSAGREVLEWIVTFAVAVVLALTIRTFLGEPIRVDGNSMRETLLDQEYMIVTKPEYLLGDPNRFDVVICHYPDRKENFVKRVVGLPGDTIEVRDGMLFVNGEMQDEPYITHHPTYTYGPTVVPEGQYFVLGDNRASSNDSHLVGTITRKMIVGHVQCVVWPPNRMRMVR